MAVVVLYVRSGLDHVTVTSLAGLIVLGVFIVGLLNFRYLREFSLRFLTSRT
jgi:hypothetical protein